jgi:CubicO group peptidase (beta-lactamase class C family)
MGGEARRFALLGVFGQAIYVDPQRKLVLVHTAVAAAPRIGKTTMGAELGALWQGLLSHYAN